MNVTPVLNVVSLQHMNTKGEAHPVSHTRSLNFLIIDLNKVLIFSESLSVENLKE